VEAGRECGMWWFRSHPPTPWFPAPDRPQPPRREVVRAYVHHSEGGGLRSQGWLPIDPLRHCQLAQPWAPRGTSAKVYRLRGPVTVPQRRRGAGPRARKKGWGGGGVLDLRARALHHPLPPVYGALAGDPKTPKERGMPTYPCRLCGCVCRRPSSTWARGIGLSWGACLRRPRAPT
jgi:hypothetical protein